MGRRSGFSLEEIDAALAGAGASADIRNKVKHTLAGSRKPGRKLIDDTPLLLHLAQLVADGREPYAAATVVTEGMPSTTRNATRNRIYRKYTAQPELWQERAREAKKTEAERLEEARQRLKEMWRKQEEVEEMIRRDERR